MSQTAVTYRKPTTSQLSGILTLKHLFLAYQGFKAQKKIKTSLTRLLISLIPLHFSQINRNFT